MMPVLTYADAIADVKARVKASHTSFASGMAVLPKERREAMYALYAFCRVVDDIADDSPSDDIRNDGLSLWKRRIHDLFAERKASDSITTALFHAMDRYGLVEQDFQDIIDGMAMDAAQEIVAPSLSELDTYCDRVASAVGRASVRIFGDSSETAMQVAYHLGRALQLTNILRDLGEDAGRGRLYLPAELLTKHGIETRDVTQVLKADALRDVCREVADMAQMHFTQARKAMESCPYEAMRPARTMGRYYGAILDRLIRSDWKDPTRRVSLPLYLKLWIAISGLWS